jgi:hypothetical protein
MFALIQNSKVIQIENSKFPVAKDLSWVACDSSITTDYFYINGEFKITDKSDQEFLSEKRNQKISEIKATAASLILAIYPFYKQLNILMSKDAKLIEEMNESILAIRTKSNQLEAALDLLNDLEEIKNFKTEF